MKRLTTFEQKKALGEMTRKAKNYICAEAATLEAELDRIGIDRMTAISWLFKTLDGIKKYKVFCKLWKRPNWNPTDIQWEEGLEALRILKEFDLEENTPNVPTAGIFLERLKMNEGNFI